MLKLLQFIDQLPLEKPEGTNINDVNLFTSTQYNRAKCVKLSSKWVMKCVFPVFEGMFLLRKANHMS